MPAMEGGGCDEISFIVKDNTQSNQERTKWTQNINKKLDNMEAQNCYLLTIFSPTLLLLKGYHKFVSKRQPSLLGSTNRQLAILENTHKISCVS